MRTAERWLVVEAGKRAGGPADSCAAAAAAAACKPPASVCPLPGCPPTAPACADFPAHQPTAAVVGYAAYMASLRAAQRLSPRLSSEYRRMAPQLQLEWDGR